MTFQRRLALVSAAAVAIAVALASAVVFVVVRDQLQQQVDAGLSDLADEASVTSVPVPAPGAGEGSPPVGPPLPPLEEEARPRGRIALALPNEPLSEPIGTGQLVTSEGDVLQGPPDSPPLPVSEAVREVAAGDREAFFTDSEVGGSHLRVLTTQVVPGQAVQVARSLEEVDATLRRLALVLGAVSLGGIILAAGLGHAVSRTATFPVRRLTDAAEHVARTRDLGRRIEGTHESDELGRLAKSFNAMLEELERSVKAQRQLVADASHELRTPLTSLTTNIEVLARGNDLTAPDRGRLMRDVVAQLSELGGLVGGLVDLAREDEPTERAQDVRLDELVVDAVDRAQRNARSRRFAVAVKPCVVRGVPERLDRAIANLLDNAAKWSPEGGQIDVAVRDGMVTVRDRGPGIAAEDRPHVFDRFYRAASARGMPGSGLGLAIVHQVAESHAGTVTAEAAEGGGAMLRLMLPAHEPVVS